MDHLLKSNLANDKKGISTDVLQTGLTQQIYVHMEDIKKTDISAHNRHIKNCKSIQLQRLTSTSENPPPVTSNETKERVGSSLTKTSRLLNSIQYLSTRGSYIVKILNSQIRNIAIHRKCQNGVR